MCTACTIGISVIAESAQMLERCCLPCISTTHGLHPARLQASCSNHSPYGRELPTSHMVMKQYHSLHLCRGESQQKLRELRQFRWQHMESGAADHSDSQPGSPTEAPFGSLGMLTALGRYTDRLLLLAKQLQSNEWLSMRASKAYLARNAMYY